MLEKHYINGTKKPKEEQEKHCNTCDDGKKYLDEEYIKTQQFSSDYEERICGGCNTKYRIKRKQADKMLNKSCKDCPNVTGDTESCDNKEDDYLCPGNEELIFKKILDKEVKEVDIETIKAMETFELIGMCPHVWVNSKPFHTGEGYFTIENCRVCKLGKLNYNGKMYQDDVMSLVTWLAHNGIKKLKQETQTIKQFNALQNIGTSEIGNMFDISPPDFGFEPDIHFD